ncbi:MAG: CHC2 zinc finger domain-containing protein [Acutalibacteraceae bacterium]
MKYDTEKIRSANPLSDWLNRYGIEVDRKDFAKCPFHSEKTASFRVYSDGTYHCFGCGAHGDVIDFVMNMQNLSFEDACGLLDRDISYSEQRAIDRVRRDRKSKADKRKTARINYWDAFDNWKLNEDIITAFKPSGPEEKPNPFFISALSRRSVLTHKLSLAETEYTMRG